MSKRKNIVDQLISDLDRGAKALLNEVFPVNAESATEDGAEPLDGQTPLPDKIKAFAAVTNYLGERSKLVAPAEVVRGKGERLRDQFQRATGVRGNGAAPTEESPPDPD